MKVLGGGDLSTALFVVADAFTASARSKIEAAGGSVSVLEVPDAKRQALGLEADGGVEATRADGPSEADAEAGEGRGETAAAGASEAAATEADDADAGSDGAAKKPKARKPRAAKADAPEADA